MEKPFEALEIIPIFDVLLLDNLPISSICYFKSIFSDALIPSTALFPLPGSLIAQIIITYEDYNIVNKNISKSHLYCLAQSSVSYRNLHKSDTNIPD